MPELHELVNTYHPDVIWSDGDWVADENYWRSKEFKAWLYNESPVKSTVVTNDRWGKGVDCKYGDFLFGKNETFRLSIK
jgi:alpha-L-fucosidase